MALSHTQIEGLHWMQTNGWREECVFQSCIKQSVTGSDLKNKSMNSRREGPSLFVWRLPGGLGESWYLRANFIGCLHFHNRV